MKVKGQLERAQLENKTSDYSAGTADGLIWNRTDTDDLRFDDGVKIQVLRTKDLETSFTVADNNASPASVTGLVFDKTVYSAARVEFALRRRDDGQEFTCIGHLNLIHAVDADAWDIGVEYVGDAITGLPCGVTFTITSAGQVQYISSNLAGANYAGYLRFDTVKRYAIFAS